MKARFSYFSKLLYIATYFTYLFLIFFFDCNKVRDGTSTRRVPEKAYRFH